MPWFGTPPAVARLLHSLTEVCVAGPRPHVAEGSGLSQPALLEVRRWASVTMDPRARHVPWSVPPSWRRIVWWVSSTPRRSDPPRWVRAVRLWAPTARRPQPSWRRGGDRTGGTGTLGADRRPLAPHELWTSPAPPELPRPPLPSAPVSPQSTNTCVLLRMRKQRNR
jgi:hypothetical protein